MSRLETRFGELAAAGRGGLVTFLMAGDPDPDTFARLLAELPAAGADVIEIGMPFSDPMADGPSIQAAGQRALKSGMTLPRTLEAVRAFRAGDDATPVVLMGYYNPIYSYGVDRFVPDARAAGVDGLIVVDLPPEEDRELCDPVTAGGLDWVRLVAPTTGEERMGRMLARATGFVYYVSIAGITGTRSAAAGTVETAVERLRRHTHLPVAVGFGIRTPAQAAGVARVADAAVVGTALVDVLRETLDERDRAGPESVSRVRDYVAGLAAAVRGARE